MNNVTNLKVGSRWAACSSNIEYEVMGLAIDTTTSTIVVVYQCVEANSGHFAEWFVRPIGEFLGTKKIEHSATSASYVDRFRFVGPPDKELA
jgi:hypothetical protein